MAKRYTVQDSTVAMLHQSQQVVHCTYRFGSQSFACSAVSHSCARYIVLTRVRAVTIAPLLLYSSLPGTLSYKRSLDPMRLLSHLVTTVVLSRILYLLWRYKRSLYYTGCSLPVTAQRLLGMIRVSLLREDTRCSVPP